MPHPPMDHKDGAFESLHILALSAAAFGLIVGLATRSASWVSLGVSLMLVLPPLRLATTIIGEARARRFNVAAMGVAVLIFLLVSRRIS